MSRHTVHRKDGNHHELMKRAREVFPIVEDHANASHGYDAIWANGRDVWIVEIKPPGRYKLTPNEQKAQARWGARYVVVQTEDDMRYLAGLRPALFTQALSPAARRAKRTGSP